MVIGIIGGGASGVAAALAAAENPNVEVLLLERQARVGRKLQATGNGRCNLTNLHADAGGYHGENAGFVQFALNRYPVEETLQWFSQLGLYTVSEDNGRVYPYSDQANSVVDVLRFGLQKENIRLVTGAEVTRVRKTENGFTITCTEGNYECNKLIIACGGLAGTKLGGSMSGYKLLRSLGHHCTKLRPALVQLKSSWNGCLSLKGVRANCCAEIWHNGATHSKSAGELQFTEYGLSGPVIFEISRDVCQSAGDWVCKLDFLPDMDETALYHILCSRRNMPITTDDLLTGILHNRLGRVLTAAAGVPMQRSCAMLSDEDIRQVVDVVKGLEVSLTDTMGMDSAQVTAGGICTDEFDPQTMNSRLVSDLYACGEVLDIDGDCGGYNLQWAWSSGRLAGHCAGGSV